LSCIGKAISLHRNSSPTVMTIPLKIAIQRLVSTIKSEHLSDAIRTTICIISPIFLFFYLGYPQTAIATGTGALLISATDGPNTLKLKIHSAFLNLGLFGFTAILMASTLVILPISTGVLLLLTFIYAFISCFGNRFSMSGTMAIALAIFIIGLHPKQPISFTLGIMGGGVIYYVFSILHQLIRPYRSLEQAITECLFATADFLKSKAACYNPDKNLNDAQSENIRQHIKVSEKQELVRTLLLSEKNITNQKSKKAKMLFNQCITLIDIYQQLSASHYDYLKIQSELKHTPALELIQDLIQIQVAILHQLNYPNGDKTMLQTKFMRQIELLKAVKTSAHQQHLLSDIIDNLIAIYGLLEQYGGKLLTSKQVEDTSPADYKDFITVANINFGTLKSHLNFSDPIFRFSLRLSILLAATYWVTEIFKLNQYTYWILLTILVVARPKLALTWKRNKQRVIGTFIGIASSVVLLLLTQNPKILIPAMIIFLTGFFLYSRINYLKAVALLTPTILIALALYHGNWPNIIGQRLLFTLIGCAIVIPTSYLFPIWETNRIKALLTETYTTAIVYLKATLIPFENADANIKLTNLRLARKNNYLAIAELSQALQLIRIEPHAKKLAIGKLQNLQTAAYRISSIISSITSAGANANTSLNTAQAEQAVQILEKNLNLIAHFNLSDSNQQIKTENQTAIEATAKSAVLVALFDIHQEIEQEISN